MVQSSITQKLSVPFGGGDFTALTQALSGISTRPLSDSQLLALDQIRVSLDKKNGFAVLEWRASPVADMYADTVIAILLKQSMSTEELKQLGQSVESDDQKQPPAQKKAKTVSSQAREFLFTNFLIESICEMFGLDEEQLQVAERKYAPTESNETSIKQEENHKMLLFKLNGDGGKDNEDLLVELDITSREVVRCEREAPRAMLCRLLGASVDIDAPV